MGDLADVATEDLVAELRRRTAPMDRASEILAIGQVISRIPTGNDARPYYNTPAPLIGFWATQLHTEFGVRVHPELATKEIVRVKSAAGNHGPTQVVTKNTPAPMSGGPDLLKAHQNAHAVMTEWLEVNMPELAARLAKARGDATATALLIAEIRREHPEVMERGQQILRDAAPGVFE